MTLSFSCKGRLCPGCVGRRMAVDRSLFTALLRTFLRTLFAWQRRRGRALGIPDGQTGAVSFLQRFGGALDLHPHVHSLVPDGLFVPAADGLLTFVPLPPPTDEDVATLALKIAHRLTAVVAPTLDDGRQTVGEFEGQRLDLVVGGCG